MRGCPLQLTVGFGSLLKPRSMSLMPLKLLMSWGAISGESWGQIGFLSWVSSVVLAFGSKKLGSGFSFFRVVASVGLRLQLESQLILWRREW